VALQFERFRATGLPLDHVNGHLNFHLHPTVLRILLRNADRWGIHRLRVTSDPFLLNAGLAGGAWLYRTSHALIFNLLSAWARPKLRRLGIRHTDRVFGLLQNGRVHEDFVLRLIDSLQAGDSELYAHPSETDFRHETAALVSPRVRRAVEAGGIQLIRYQDL
jgi:chitin disaccharide deacetylase